MDIGSNITNLGRGQKRNSRRNKRKLKRWQNFCAGKKKMTCHFQLLFWMEKSDGNGAFIVGQSKSARRKSKIRKSPILETASVRIFRKGPMSIETNIHVRSSDRLLSHGYVETPARSIHSMQKQPKSMKSDNSGKADNRSSTVKCYEKFHWSNGRPHYRYDYQFCGCNPQSSNKPSNDSRIADTSDPSMDMSKSFYRIGNHIPGPILDNCGVYKGKTPAGMVSGGRGEVHHKKVWEPLESRH